MPAQGWFEWQTTPAGKQPHFIAHAKGAAPSFAALWERRHDQCEALARVVDALEEAIAARIHMGQEIPSPSHGENRARLPTLTAVKVILYQGMKDRGIGKAELARRLGWHLPQVDRVLDLRHRSRLDRMDAALGAVGRHLEVSARDDASLQHGRAARPPPRPFPGFPGADAG